MKPILFNTEMVRAILEGRKTVTRRAVKPQPESRPTPMKKDSCWPGCFAIQGTAKVIRPPYQPGDTLWVRETWAKDPFGDGYIYPTEVGGAGQKWHPSIHMPKEAARLFLRVTDVRAERLQDITPEQARSEGCDGRCNCPSSGAPGSLSCVERDFSIEKFESVWDSTIKPTNLHRYGWDANPWVWAIEFERVSKDEALGGGGDG